VHALFVTELVWQVATAPGFTSSGMFHFYIVTLVAGYLASIGIAVMGLWRRQLMKSAWVLLLIPVYWLMLSLAAWRAAFQLIRDPYRWEKTEHGLARTSRLANDANAAFRRPRSTIT
jgi:hypothetical protein